MKARFILPKNVFSQVFGMDWDNENIDDEVIRMSC